MVEIRVNSRLVCVIPGPSWSRFLSSRVHEGRSEHVGPLLNRCPTFRYDSVQRRFRSRYHVIWFPINMAVHSSDVSQQITLFVHEKICHCLWPTKPRRRHAHQSCEIYFALVTHGDHVWCCMLLKRVYQCASVKNLFDRCRKINCLVHKSVSCECNSFVSACVILDNNPLVGRMAHLPPPS